MTKLEIIDELTRVYITNPILRATTQDGSTCLYQTDDGRQCIVGRCLLPGTIFMGDPSGDDFKNAPEGCVTPRMGGVSNIKKFESKLQPSYRGHEISFWEDLQEWHDRVRNWNASSISPFGEQHLAELRDAYRND